MLPCSSIAPGAEYDHFGALQVGAASTTVATQYLVLALAVACMNRGTTRSSDARHPILLASTGSQHEIGNHVKGMTSQRQDGAPRQQSRGQQGGDRCRDGGKLHVRLSIPALQVGRRCTCAMCNILLCVFKTGT